MSRKLFLERVSSIYLQVVSNSITNFGIIKPYLIIKNLQDNYGTISQQDLDANDQRMKTA